MDAFKQQLQRIQDQLSGLSGTQRMLVFALVAVMVLTLMLWSRYAAAPDRVPLFTQGVADQDSARVQAALQARGIPFSTSGATILVQPDDRMRAIAAVTSDNALPSQSSRILDDIMAKMTPFDSSTRTSELWKQHRIATVRDLISLMDNVQEVKVNLDLTHQQRFNSTISPTVGVNIITHTPSQPPGRSWVEGVGKLVAGSIAGIKRENIHIVVDSRPYELQSGFGAGSGGTAGAGEVIEMQTEWEKRFAQKVAVALGDIPGLYVSVSARLNTESKETRLQQYDDIKTKERELTQETSESVQSTAAAPVDPGVGANTGGSLSIASGSAGGGNTTTTEKSVTKNELFPTVRDEVTKKPGGDATAVAAAITVPRSWYVNQLKTTNPSGQDPDPAAVEAKIAVENAAIQEQVRAVLGLTDASAVTVRAYVDVATGAGPGGFDAAGGASLANATGAGGLLTTSLGRYAREIAVGLLAAVSLLMVMMIVRKGTPAPLPPPEPARSAIPSMVEVVASEPLAGIAAPGNPALDAMELGEDDLRGQQVVDQVNSMVKENPDAAAALVKRWLNRS